MMGNIFILIFLDNFWILGLPLEGRFGEKKRGNSHFFVCLFVFLFFIAICEDLTKPFRFWTLLMEQAFFLHLVWTNTCNILIYCILWGTTRNFSFLVIWEPDILSTFSMNNHTHYFLLHCEELNLFVLMEPINILSSFSMKHMQYFFFCTRNEFRITKKTSSD